MKLTLAAGLFVAASAAAMAQTPAGSSQGSTSRQSTSTQQNGSGTASQQQNARGAEQSVTGCLTQADNIFTLTVMNATPGTTASTTVYTLAPGTGVDLKPHIDKMVTVKGTDAGAELQNSTRVVQSTPPSPAATGTSGTAGANSSAGATGNAGANNGQNSGNAGGGTPTVQTTAKARITARTLNITSVQPATGSCGANR